MAKEVCAMCHGPREPESSYGSYCIACGKVRQRGYYRKMREEAGFKVKARIESPEDVAARLKGLRDGDGQPGDCDVCNEHSDALGLLGLARSQKHKEVGVGTPYLLLCERCMSVVGLTSDQIRRVKQLHLVVLRADDSWDMLVPPTSNWTTQGVVPE